MWMKRLTAKAQCFGRLQNMRNSTSSVTGGALFALYQKVTMNGLRPIQRI